jgi:TIR domain
MLAIYFDRKQGRALGGAVKHRRFMDRKEYPMSDEVGIFISYAHNDDLQLRAAKDEKGFVTFFCEMLRTKLRDLGATRAKIWLDRQRISDGDQFEGKIDDGLKKAQILIVVMSNNWLDRRYCRRELDEFVELRRAAGVDNVAERVVVVGKGHVDRLKRPPLLQTQEGFLFYARDDQNDVAEVKPFFNSGDDACDDRFYDRRDDLAAFLQRRVDRIAEGAGTGAMALRDQPIASPNGRIIYLAKPAADMEAAYSRVAFELQGRGYTVVPEVNSDIPKNAAVRDYVKTALETAEVSIHLLGDKRGFVPDDDELDPIVKLQLGYARERAARSAQPSESVFRRIVWAPKILDTADQPAGPTVERDPLKVLERFDGQFPTDKIDGDILSKFVEFLFQYLTQTAPRSVPVSPSGDKLEVFLSYHGADEDYAGAVVEALRGSPVRIQIPAAGSDAETRRYNDDLLANCDAVTLCWANASEVWVRSEADRLKDWETLGRKQEFAFRSLIAGPPPAAHKRAQFMKILFQDGQFDKVLDLVEKGSPTPELLADLAPAPAGPGP